MADRNLTYHEEVVSRDKKSWLCGHSSCVLWFTGLSGSGKSTLANALERKLFDMGCKTHLLDGDNVRMGLNSDLGFSPEDREENIRRIGEVANLFKNSGTITLTAFISPYHKDRERARTACGDNFFEIHVAAPLETCEARDPKGLYKKARAGVIKGFTGIDAPYEEPLDPALYLDTSIKDVDKCCEEIINLLIGKGIIDKPREISVLDKRRTIALDFDGVIHAYSKGFQGLDNVYDEPHVGALEGISALSELGYRLIVVSSRPVPAIQKWLTKHSIDHYFEEITNIKRPAKHYIDDHGYRFEKGNVNSWPQVIEMIIGEKND